VNAGYGDTVIGVFGLPDAAVKESRDRVMTGPINSGFSFTFGRTVINLAPADVKKEGLSSIASAKEEPSFDLPIAIGIAAASEQIETDKLENFMIVGELAPDGGVRPVKGVLRIALRAREAGMTGMTVPADNAAEAAVVPKCRVRLPIAKSKRRGYSLGHDFQPREGDHRNPGEPLRCQRRLGVRFQSGGWQARARP
jgi:magnesium chelatase family protein